MNNSPASEPAGASASQDEIFSAMFASLVIQQSNMASIFLGLTPHPQTGQIAQDLEHARYFIDQLEMLEAKTRGNLDKMEQGLLKQSLTSLRLAFVEAVSKPVPAPAAEEKAAPVAEAEAAKPADTAPEAASEAATVDDSRKKFSKKY
jgi:hypothetical protein